MSCPEPDELQGFFWGRLNGHQRTRIEQHIDRCSLCRRTLAALAKSPDTQETTKKQETLSGLETLLDPLRVDHGSGSVGQIQTLVDNQPLSASDPVYLKMGEIFADRFRIEGLLGHGGMGAVYLASHTILQRQCAIKLIRSELTTDLEIRARFQREAMAACKVDHPHVADIFDFGYDLQGRPYLVMEYIEGPSLAEVISGRPLLPVSHALDLLWQIADALAAAHNLGIVHRDLKPQNIILGTRATALDDVKILDFGLAKILDTTGEITARGAILGTLLFMSPEQFLGKVVNHRTDIYSFGVVAFELLCGRPPFGGKSHQITQAHVLQSPPSPSTVSAHSHFPAALDHLILKCLCKDPDQRYQSSRDLAQELKEIQRSVVETPPETREHDPSATDQPSAFSGIAAQPLPEKHGFPWRWRPRTVSGWVLIIGAIFAIWGMSFLTYKLSSFHSPEPPILAGAEPVTLPSQTMKVVNLEPSPPRSQKGAADVRPQAADLAPSSNGALVDQRPRKPSPRPKKAAELAPSQGVVFRSNVLSDPVNPWSVLRVATLIDGQSTPAEVYLNGQWVGQSPLELQRLKAGTHQLKVVKTGFMTIRKTIKLSAKDITKEVFSLQK